MSAGGITGKGRPKSVMVAALLSAFACPGAGQLYNGHRVRGIALVTVSVLLVTAAVGKVFLSAAGLMMDSPVDEIPDSPFVLLHKVLAADAGFLGWALALFLAVWAYSIIDALVSRPG